MDYETIYEIGLAGGILVSPVIAHGDNEMIDNRKGWRRRRTHHLITSTNTSEDFPISQGILSTFFSYTHSDYRLQNLHAVSLLSSCLIIHFFPFNFYSVLICNLVRDEF
jgi:hypothetical protein